MPTAPIKILLYVLGALVGATGVAYYAGALDPLLDERAQERQLAATQDSAQQAASSDAQEPASSTTAKTDRSEAASVDQSASGMNEGEADGEPAGSENNAQEVAVPRFDLVRAEPNGDLVVAGNAAPDSEIEVLSGTRVLARTTSGAGGDFVAVLDEPLSAGDHNIVLRSTGPDKLAATSVETAIVSIPEGEQGQVLAMVQEPGAPTRVVSRPEAPKPVADQPGDDAQGSQTAQSSGEAKTRQSEAAAGGADTLPNDEASAVADAADAPSSGENGPSESASAGLDGASGESAPAAAGEGVAANDVAASGEGATDAATAEAQAPGQELASENGSVEPEGQEAARTAEAGAQADDRLEEQAGAADATGVSSGSDAGENSAPTTTAADFQMPFIEAVEIDGEQVFVAGRAARGAKVRVYFDDILIGQSEAGPDGHFLVDASRTIPVGDYTVRADVIGEDGQSVIARAAVPFSRQEGAHVAAVASRPDAPSVQPEATDETQMAESTSAENGEASQERSASESTAAASASGGEETSTGAAPAPSSMSADAGNQAQTEAAEGATSSATREASADDTSESNAGDQVGREQEMAAVPDTAAEPAGTANESASTSAAPAQTTAPALQPVDGAVIIRRGDTLWHISRRVYGRGMRYTTIYLANQDQIRDPDLIWPGQVFSLPAESAEGEPADLTAIDERRAESSPAQ